MILAPAKTPADIGQKLSAEIALVLKDPEVERGAANLGFEIDANGPVSPQEPKSSFGLNSRPPAKSSRNWRSNRNEGIFERHAAVAAFPCHHGFGSEHAERATGDHVGWSEKVL